MVEENKVKATHCCSHNDDFILVHELEVVSMLNMMPRTLSVSSNMQRSFLFHIQYWPKYRIAVSSQRVSPPPGGLSGDLCPLEGLDTCLLQEATRSVSDTLQFACWWVTGWPPRWDQTPAASEVAWLI